MHTIIHVIMAVLAINAIFTAYILFAMSKPKAIGIYE